MRTAPRGRAAARRSALLVAAVLSGSLAVTGCTADPPPVAAPASGVPLVGAAASHSRAAELQAGLTHLLVERVYFT